MHASMHKQHNIENHINNIKLFYSYLLLLCYYVQKTRSNLNLGYHFLFLLHYCNLRYSNDNKVFSTSEFLRILICACQHADSQNLSICKKYFRKNILLETKSCLILQTLYYLRCLHASMHKHRKYQTRN